MKKLLLPIVLITSLLAACTATGPEGAKAIGSWKPLGELSNGRIKASYDTGSIKRKGDLAELRDRKIVSDPAKERYPDTPVYKTAVGQWEFNCKQRSYRLSALQLWDSEGKPVASHHYTPSEIPARPIAKGSPTEKQFDAACGKP